MKRYPIPLELGEWRCQICPGTKAARKVNGKWRCQRCLEAIRRAREQAERAGA